ncbi:MAG: hypothetical protein LBH06_09455 [Rikenellaceae bacterium]|jgi:hypothetical protein|nr:hypothetical protein [Rikenellaceae bacterium]
MRIFGKTVLIIAALALAACNAAYQAFKSGDYERACAQAVDRLRIRPDDAKAQSALAGAYPFVKNMLVTQANAAAATGSFEGFDRAIASYDNLNRLGTAIALTPGALAVVPAPTYYNDELRSVREQAAAAAYAAGDRALRAGTTEQTQLAKQYFAKANSYVPGYRDAADRVQQAREQGAELSYRDAMQALNVGTQEQARRALTLLNSVQNDYPGYRDVPTQILRARDAIAGMMYRDGDQALAAGTIDQGRVALNIFQQLNREFPNYRDVASNKIPQATYNATVRVVVMKPQTNAAYQLSGDFFYDKLMSDITRRTFKNLIRFYTPAEAENLRMNNPHQVVALDFADFVVGNSRESSSTEELKRDSVVVGQVNVGGAMKNVYGTVRCKYTKYRVEILSGGTLAVRIVDPASSRIIQHIELSGSTVWFSEWASFNGDERALSNAQRNIVGQKQLPPPPPQELFKSFALPLYDKASKFIVGYYGQ